jgi:hypothetical protein
VRRWLSRPEAALFVLALGTYAYFFQAGGWNQNVRLDLTRAILEEHTVVIDDYVGNTGDFSVFNRHFYCDKAPGVSVLSLPVYAAWSWVARDMRPRGRMIHLGGYLVTLWAIGLPSALAVAVLFRLALRWSASAPAAAGLALAWAFGTIALPYATLLYGHQLAAALLVLAVALVARAPDVPASNTARWTPVRLFAAGLLLGTAFATEYPVALPLAAIGLYALVVVRPWPRLVWLALGAAPPILALAVYHTAAFGSPLTFPYAATQDVARERGLFLGITLPDPRVAYKVLFSFDRGLLEHAPWLALALPGGLRMAARRERRAEGLLCLSVMALGLWFNASLTTTRGDWKGGSGIGTRHLVASLPFYVLAMVGLIAPAPSWWRRRSLRWAAVAVFAALVVASTAKMVAATAVRPEPSGIDDPFVDYIWPRWQRGEVAVNTMVMHNGPMADDPQAWNLGQKWLGLTGRTSLVPLAGFALLGTGWLAWTVRRPRAY